MNTASEASNQKPLVMAGAFMCIGLGGFFDGILFHQLLQIHNMLSAIRPPTSVPNIEKLTSAHARQNP
ncbi:MAG: DUF2243 domain-containing protein [Chthoniobacterales bacterium]|nr:DUF2243 domain-containing protein [Chthoniobacterales bacterium]